MSKKQVLINAVMSFVQIVVISCILFVLYRFLLNILGVKKLGIWSLVLATTSITQIANLGLSGSVVKFVAKYVARKEDENISAVVQTAAISVGFFSFIILIILFPVAKRILELVVPHESIHLAISILPHAFVALWLLIVTSIFHAGFDGLQRIDFRSLLVMFSALMHLVLCYILAPVYGLIGLAYARVIQNIIILLCSWFFLKRFLSTLPLLPYKWSKHVFKEIIGYGVNFQIMSVTSLFFDPITKAFMSKFGGLSMVGYYEMGNKMIQQFRALVVSSSQVIVPFVANLYEKAPEKVKSVYMTTYQLLFYLSVPLFSFIIICAPLISKIWIGHYEKVFVRFSLLLAIGWLINTLNTPAYFSYLGIGYLRWNLIGQITIAVMNIVLGLILGIKLGGTGVVYGWVISLTIGSSVVCVSYILKNKIHFAELLPRSSRGILAVCAIGITISVGIQAVIKKPVNFIMLDSTIVFVFLLILAVPIWIHPMRKLLFEWGASELLNRGK